MHDQTSSTTELRPRALLLTYHYDRTATMESRLSWRRAQHAAEEFATTVVCAEEESKAEELETPGSPDAYAVEVIAIPHSRMERFVMRLPWGFYLAYRLWHRRVLKRMQIIHKRRPFDLVHHVSFCGYREPSDGWRLEAPFVWGPIGGTHNFPTRFLSQVNFMGGARELARNALNSWQLRHSRLVKQALQAADVVAVASESAKDALSALTNRPPQVLLETGVDRVETTRSPRDPKAPLKVLWSGRLQCWKGLPLLLRAIAQLPPDVPVQLRVLGEGPCLVSWQKLAKQLGITEQVQWIDWPSYQWQLPHYQWADAFAFTSLRDTSGTGLLEALAAGAPIIGVDHQGAADIMTAGCALPITVDTPKQTIGEFRDAMVRLATDPQLLSQLSQGAMLRSVDFCWEGQRLAMKEIYATALQAVKSAELARADDLENNQQFEVIGSSDAKASTEVFEEKKRTRGVVFSS